MQNANMPDALHSLNGSGDSSSIALEPTATPANTSPEQDQPAAALKSESAARGAQSLLQAGAADAHQRTFLPDRGLYYAVIAGVIVSLIASYPGNLVVNRTPLATGGLVISLLFFCLWSIGGGLVSLFGTWIVTVRHPHYRKSGE